MKKAQENTLVGLCIHKGCGGGGWRYIIVICLADLVHGEIKKNRKEKHCGFRVLSPCVRP